MLIHIYMHIVITIGSISGYEIIDERIDEERFNLTDHLQVRYILY